MLFSVSECEKLAAGLACCGDDCDIVRKQGQHALQGGKTPRPGRACPEIEQSTTRISNLRFLLERLVGNAAFRHDQRIGKLRSVDNAFNPGKRREHIDGAGRK
jgi:hypothetical protein